MVDLAALDKASTTGKRPPAYDPGETRVHELALELVATYPVGHGVQLADPATEKDPETHDTHEVDVEAP